MTVVFRSVVQVMPCVSGNHHSIDYRLEEEGLHLTLVSASDAVNHRQSAVQ